MQAQRKGTDAYNKKIMHDKLEKDAIDALTNLETDIDVGYETYIRSIFKEYNLIARSEKLCRKVVEARFKNNSSVSKWGNFVHNLMNISANCIPMIIDPTVKLINLIGPGVHAISAEDFVKYHSVFIQVSNYIRARGVNKEAFSAIRNSYRELIFDEKFLRIINHNTDNDKMIDDLRYLVGPNSFESYFPYHSSVYKELLNINHILCEILVEGWGEIIPLENYIDNSQGVSEGIDFSTETDKKIIDEWLEGDEHKEASKNLLSIIDSNIDYKTRLYEDLIAKGILSPTVDPARDSVLFKEDLSGMSNWSDSICTISHVTYNILDFDGQKLKSAIEKYKLTSYEVSFAKIMEEMNEVGLDAIKARSLPQFKVSNGDSYISDTVVKYPHDYMPTTSWNDVKRLMIDFNISSAEEIIKDALEEKSDNLYNCMEMQLEDAQGLYQYLQDQMHFRARI